MEVSIGVVGGGMFGVTSAVELAKDDYNITLYEKNDDILKGASGANHWRLHRGYHYPLSDPTADSAKQSEPLFRERYSDAVIEGTEHYYAIAENSRVSYPSYLEFLKSHELDYEFADMDLVNRNRIRQVLRVNETHVSVEKLRELCWNELREAEVETYMQTEIKSLDDLQHHDHIVIATYAHLNQLLPQGHNLRRRYKFEVCEVPIVKLPDKFIEKSIIVVYGPFMSVDPWGDSDYFLMGDYHNMRHHATTGFIPKAPAKLRTLVNDGPIENPPITNFESFKQNGQKYIPGVADADHIGSYFTIRTILPNVEDTAARPTLVEGEDNILLILGGKLATSVHTAQEVVNKAEKIWN